MKGNKNNDVNFTRLNFQLITQRMKQNMKNNIIWGVSPCYLVEIYREVIRTCSLVFRIEEFFYLLQWRWDL